MTNPEINIDNPEKKKRTLSHNPEISEHQHAENETVYIEVQKNPKENIFEQFRAERERVNELLERLSSLTYTHETQGEPNANLISSFEDESIHSEEIKSQFTKLAEKVWQDNESLDNELDLIKDSLVNSIEQFDLGSTNDISQLSGLLDSYTQQTNSLWNKARQINDDIATVWKLKELYLDTVLSENEFDSFDAIDRSIEEKQHHVTDLKNTRFESWRNRKEIKKYKTEINRLNTVRSTEWDTTVSVPTTFHIDILERHAINIAQQMFNKLANYYSTQPETPIDLKTRPETLEQQHIDGMNNTFVAQHVQPQFDSRIAELENNKENLGHHEETELNNLSEPENQKKAIELINRAFGTIRQYDDGSVLSMNEAWIGLEEEVQNLPRDVQEIVKRFMPFPDKNMTMDDDYHLAAYVVSHTNDYYTVKKSQLILSDMETFATRANVPYEVTQDRHKISNAKGKITQEEGFKYYEKALTENLDMQRWIIFKDDPHTQKLFSKNQLEVAHTLIESASLENLLSSTKHTNRSVQLGSRALEFNNSSSAPFVIMNCYREPGYSGERPFTQWGNSSKASELYQYVSRISEEDKTTLKKSNITGLPELLQIIEDHPDDFLAPRIYETVDGSETARDNPVYQETQQLLGAMSHHYITQGSAAERYFALSLLKDLRIPLEGQLAAALKDSIISETDEKVRTETIETLREHAAMKDASAAELIVSCWRDLNPLVKDEIRSIGPELVESVIDKDELSNEESHGLSEILNISQEQLIETRALLLDLKDNEIINYLSHTDLKQFDKYIALAPYREKLIGLIVQLKEYNYYFSILHDKALLEMLDKEEEIMEGIHTIREHFPDFYYQLSATRSKVAIEQSGATKVTTEQVYLTNPYEILAFRTGGSELIDKLKTIKEKDGTFDRAFSDGLYCILQESDLDDTDQQQREVFYRAIDSAVDDFGVDGPHNEWRDFMLKRGINSVPLRFLSNAPDKYDDFVALLDSPYGALLKHMHPGGRFDQYSYNVFTTLDQYDDLSEGIDAAMVTRLRKYDPVLVGLDKPIETDEIIQHNYHKSIEKLLETISQGDDPELYHNFFLDASALGYLARQPERVDDIIRLIDEAPNLFKQLQPGGILHSNIHTIARDIFENGNVLRRAQETEVIVSKKIPYWKFLYFYTDRRIGEQLAAATSQYPITEIDGRPLSYYVDQHHKVTTKNPNAVSRLNSIVPDDEIREKIANGNQTHVSFRDISGIYKRIIYRDYLKKTIETSRSDEVKNQADERNRQNADSNLSLKGGDYLHASAVEHMPDVLLNGNLPQESLGETAATDAYPFHVDFTKLGGDTGESPRPTQEILNSSLSSAYGSMGEHGNSGQVFYVYDRERANYEPGKEYCPVAISSGTLKQNHALMLGGIPSTEINAIALTDPDTALERAKNAVLENGFYIPVYSSSGELLFSPDDFDAEFSDRNLSVEVEVWDYQQKIADQKGSNPGGVFAVPTKDGPVNHYVKFGERGSKEEIQMWTEVLCDAIYKECNIPVPDSQIVKVEGTYGRASKMIDGHDPDAQIPNFDSGFIADVLTQNYWDLKPENGLVGKEDDTTYRIDNGAAFPDYRGTKIAGEYNLQEILDNALEGTMPGGNVSYSAIPREELTRQAQVVAGKLNPAKIESLVNNIRLPRETREQLIADINERINIIKKTFDV